MGGKIFQPSAQLPGFRPGRAKGRQEDLLSLPGKCPLPCREEGRWPVGPWSPDQGELVTQASGPKQAVSSCGLWTCLVPKGPQAPRSQGAGAQGSWVQLGLTQLVTPAESLPLGSLPASVSSGRTGSWEQGLAGNEQLALHLWTLRGGFSCLPDRRKRLPAPPSPKC